MVYWVVGRRKPAVRAERDPGQGPGVARLGPFESLEQARQAMTRAAGAQPHDGKGARLEIVCDYA